jgi:hypothetical protein
MISSSPVLFSPGEFPAGAAIADPHRAPAHMSAETIDARMPASASAAHNTFFMYESP